MTETMNGECSSMPAETLYCAARQLQIQPQPPALPIILLLGPPGCGKGTLGRRLAPDYDLHHLSTGDWLRAQARPPIAGVSTRINAYVFAGEVVPEKLLTEEFDGNDDGIPPALLQYNCGKRNVSTPSEMWVRALPALRREVADIASAADVAGNGLLRGILLDNLPKTLVHAEAAVKIFGSAFPALTIGISCPEDLACERFLARGRGSDDATVFRRRFARSARETPGVLEYLGRRGGVVHVGTAGEAEATYGELVTKLEKVEVWRGMLSGCGNESETGGEKSGMEDALGCLMME